MLFLKIVEGNGRSQSPFKSTWVEDGSMKKVKAIIWSREAYSFSGHLNHYFLEFCSAFSADRSIDIANRTTLNRSLWIELDRIKCNYSYFFFLSTLQVSVDEWCNMWWVKFLLGILHENEIVTLSGVESGNTSERFLVVVNHLCPRWANFPHRFVILSRYLFSLPFLPGTLMQKIHLPLWIGSKGEEQQQNNLSWVIDLNFAFPGTWTSCLI